MAAEECATCPRRAEFTDRFARIEARLGEAESDIDKLGDQRTEILLALKDIDRDFKVAQQQFQQDLGLIKRDAKWAGAIVGLVVGVSSSVLSAALAALALRGIGG